MQQAHGCMYLWKNNMNEYKVWYKDGESEKMEDGRLELFIGEPYDGFSIWVNKARYTVELNAKDENAPLEKVLYFRQITAIDGKQFTFFALNGISIAEAFKMMMGKYRRI